ncbi:MAG: N5-glutamine methyltransferase family protein [Candidatus Saccharimonadales bacterium]
MKISEWLKSATKKLESAGIGTARLDALVLAEDATGHDRAYLLAHPEKELANKQVSELASKLQRRQSHEPLAYIRGFTEFYGRKFIIDARVLEPRPESETMIDLFKKSAATKVAHVIDVGTGSGALAITAKLEFPTVQVSALDIDPKCLVVAKINAKNCSVSIDFYQGDLLDPLPSTISHQPSAILANLPYVPDNFTVNQAASHEPKTAIYGGPDGLDLYRQLFHQINTKNITIQYIFTESLPPQHVELSKIASSNGFKLSQSEDFIQVFVKS